MTSIIPVVVICSGLRNNRCRLESTYQSSTRSSSFEWVPSLDHVCSGILAKIGPKRENPRGPSRQGSNHPFDSKQDSDLFQRCRQFDCNPGSLGERQGLQARTLSPREGSSDILMQSSQFQIICGCRWASSKGREQP